MGYMKEKIQWKTARNLIKNSYKDLTKVTLKAWTHVSSKIAKMNIKIKTKAVAIL